MKKQHGFLMAVLLLAAGAAGCGNSGGNIEVLDTGLVSVNGQEIILAENTDTASSLWLVAGDRAGEAVGSLISRTGGTTQATITGAVYVTPAGEGFTVTLDAQGYPGTITYTDGSVMKLTNYTENTVDVRLTPAGGTASAPQTIDLNENFAELKALIKENGLAVDTATGNTATDRMLRSIGLSDYAWDARTRKTVIKITGTALSIAGCVGAIFISELAPPVAAIACTSAYAGLVSTVEYIADVKVFEGDDAAGGVSFILSAGACAGLSLPDCASTLLSIADAAIADCVPAKEQFVKRCYGGNVYWFNDCGVRSEPAEECPCGCENGACIPVSACTGLAITVHAQASPACAATGENIFFSSSVSGGDSASYVYAWDFGDGGSSALDADAHRYTASGRKTVTLTVADSQGNYGFASIPVQVENCEQFLEAEIISTPDCTEKLKAVDFGSRVRGGDGNYSYFWTFGDGSTSAAANPTHRYSRDGLYMTTLTVTDGLNNRALDAFGIQIGDCPSDITVTVSADKACFEAGETVYLSAAVTGAGVSTVSYLWDFGDGTTSTLSQTASHAYSAKGAYTVTVTVTDAAGNSGTGTLSVQVGNCDGDDGTDDGDGGDSGDYDFDTCYAMGDLTVSATNLSYGNVGTPGEWCTSKIHFKNNGSINIVVMWFVEDTAHGQEKINADGWLTTSVTAGGETTGIDPAWFSDDFNKRYIKTTHATAYYLDYNDPLWDSQCNWIFNVVHEKPYELPPSNIRTVDVSGLNPCQ